MAEASAGFPSSVQVERWSSERPLRVLVWLTALALWAVLAMSVIGIAYVVFLGVFFFVAHIAFISHLRGNAVRLGPEQMPELYERVVRLSERVGLERVPDAYVVQAGGVLNALATRFLRSNFIVLFSDLLEACGDNTEARDFIIAHELGHLHAGHLRFRWLLLPGLFFPFLGTAYSRACEYTCDRYGVAASDASEDALDGLCILAAGGKHGPRVNRRALVAQRGDLNTVWMKIGHWISTHPPIAHRLAALQPSLADGKLGGTGAALGAVAVIALAVILPIAGAVGFTKELLPLIQSGMEAQQQAGVATEEPPGARAQAEEGILSLAQAAEAFRQQVGRPPSDADELYRAWSSLHPDALSPLDPYSRAPFGYRVENADYVIWSTGPDLADVNDDLYYASDSAGGS